MKHSSPLAPAWGRVYAGSLVHLGLLPMEGTGTHVFVRQDPSLGPGSTKPTRDGFPRRSAASSGQEHQRGTLIQGTWKAGIWLGPYRESCVASMESVLNLLYSRMIKNHRMLVWKRVILLVY